MKKKEFTYQTFITMINKIQDTKKNFIVASSNSKFWKIIKNWN